VLPGLVNAHAHLELSGLRGQITGGRGFVDWVERLIAARHESSPEDDEVALDQGLDELVTYGTAAVGEVTNSLATASLLARRGIAGALFHEVFGTSRAAVMARVQGLQAEIEARFAARESNDLFYAPAAHTLYTTHPDAVRAIVDQARAHDRRTSLHIAEHPAERRALEHGDGPIPEWLTRRVRGGANELVWPMMGPFAYADSLGALGPHVLLVHLTDARPAELDLVMRRGAPIVVCPRSNLYIEGTLPPLYAMMRAGLEPALGTDSLASNASLDVLAEARALKDRFPEVRDCDLLRMATWNGARALGCDAAGLGRIARGSHPGIIAIEGDVCDADPCAFVLKNVKVKRRWVVSSSGHPVLESGAA
jgi:cytosine/adenosine deaminase-related metal-dependent hydrolase